jgi:sorting nexin-8
LSTLLKDGDLPLPRLEIVPPPAARQGIERGYSIPDTPGLGWDSTPKTNGFGHGITSSPALDEGLPSGFGRSNAAVEPDVEAERGYWKRLEKVQVSLISEREGWFLQKYRIESDVSCCSS